MGLVRRQSRKKSKDRPRDANRRNNAASRRADRLDKYHMTMLGNIVRDNNAMIDSARGMMEVLHEDRTSLDGVRLVLADIESFAPQLKKTRQQVAALSAGDDKKNAAVTRKERRICGEIDGSLAKAQSLLAAVDRAFVTLVEEYKRFRGQAARAGRSYAGTHSKYVPYLEMQTTMITSGGDLTRSDN